MEPVLFYGVPQGCSFGSIVALEWLGQPYRLCRIEMLEQPWDRLYGRINPLYKTPALLLENGAAISENLAILLNLAARGVHRQLGFRQGTPEFDRLNQLLAYLNSDFFAAFGPLWAAYEMQEADEAKQALLKAIGRENVAKNCAYLDALLADREWLLGGARKTLADAYLTGIGRWVEYHQLFDLAREYPHLHRHLQKLQADPAVVFARAIEQGQPAIGSGGFMGHLSLEELRPRLAA